MMWPRPKAESMALLDFLPGNPRELHALIGYGQGGDIKTGETGERLTARPETATAFRDRLTALGLTTCLTHQATVNFRGRDSKRLNQWFVQQG